MNRAGSAPGFLSRLPHSARTSSTKPAVTHSVSTPSGTSSDNPVHGCMPSIMHPRVPTHDTIVCSPRATALANHLEVADLPDMGLAYATLRIPRGGSPVYPAWAQNSAWGRPPRGGSA